MLNAGLFSSNSIEWETPQPLYDYLDSIYHFTLDACATEHNAKCKNYLRQPDRDAFKTPWTGRVFMNPPYGRYIGDWVHRASAQAVSKDVEFVVCLLPARTDTKWWHDCVMFSKEIHFIKGRLSFSGYGPAPFPSCIVVFNGYIYRPVLVGALEKSAWDEYETRG